MDSTLDSPPQRPFLQRLLGLVLLPLLYYAGAKFAIEFTLMPDGSAIVWPPNSVLLAAFLLLGRRDLVLLAALSLGAEIAGDMPSFKWYEAFCFGIGNVTEVAIAFFLLRRWRFDQNFSTLSDLLKFIVAVLILAALAGAIIGASLYSFFRPLGTTYPEQIRSLWFGDALGLMILTPLWLSLWPYAGVKGITAPFRRLDFAIVFMALAMLGMFALSRDGQLWGVHIGPTLLLPFVIYIGGRFGPRWSALAIAVVALVVMLMLGKGQDPFGPLSSREAVIQAQEFIFIMSLMGLGSAALLWQLRSKQSELETANHSLGELNRNLESRVAQRTTELVQANNQLVKEVGEREQAEQSLVVANQELERLAKVDGLTQIANRRTFDAQLRREWSRLSREGAVLSLLLFDIDFFKRYNDFYGHQAGDACLIQMAATVSGVVKRPADLVARYGGEEFAVILPETDSAGAIAVAQQIHEAILQQAIPHELSEVSDTISVSVGVATCVPNAQERPESLIERADQALYRAKDQGRNRYSL